MKSICLKDVGNFTTINIVEEDAWNRILNQFTNIDSYYTIGYVKSFMAHGDGTPVMLVFHKDEYIAINVVMVRRINDIKSLDLGEVPELYDISTPYGYGGFLANKALNMNIIKEFDNNYIQFCSLNNIVCEFVRFHPILENAFQFSKIYNINRVGETVAMYLDSEEKVWNAITSENRNVIRKAKKIMLLYERDILKIFLMNLRTCIIQLWIEIKQSHITTLIRVFMMCFLKTAERKQLFFLLNTIRELSRWLLFLCIISSFIIIYQLQIMIIGHWLQQTYCYGKLQNGAAKIIIVHFIWAVVLEEMLVTRYLNLKKVSIGTVRVNSTQERKYFVKRCMLIWNARQRTVDL